MNFPISGLITFFTNKDKQPSSSSRFGGAAWWGHPGPMRSAWGLGHAGRGRRASAWPKQQPQRPRGGPLRRAGAVQTEAPAGAPWLRRLLRRTQRGVPRQPRQQREAIVRQKACSQQNSGNSANVYMPPPPGPPRRPCCLPGPLDHPRPPRGAVPATPPLSRRGLWARPSVGIDSRHAPYSPARPCPRAPYKPPRRRAPASPRPAPLTNRTACGVPACPAGRPALRLRVRRGARGRRGRRGPSATTAPWAGRTRRGYFRVSGAPRPVWTKIRRPRPPVPAVPLHLHEGPPRHPREQRRELLEK